jgi:hypothetical protein
MEQGLRRGTRHGRGLLGSHLHSYYLLLLDLDLVAGYQFLPHTQVLAENSRVSTTVTTSDAEAGGAAKAEVMPNF